MNNNWNFLKGTYWYVPEQYLPATQMGGKDTQPIVMIDQTVWQIIDYRAGYFWGNCVVLMYQQGDSPEGEPKSMKMIGSVTPDGTVQITFMPLNYLGAAMSTSGWGKMAKQNKSWTFEMQMSSGTKELYSHWAFMYSTKEGDPTWNKLPGLPYSVPELLEAAGFEV